MNGYAYLAIALFLAALGWGYGRDPARREGAGGRWMPALFWLAAALALAAALIRLTRG